MRPFSDANTWNVHTWAQVAQAVTWDDYALNSDGQVTVKATRGPVIVWGRRTGEGEDVPRLEAPTPSPLEVEAARVNLKAHALAFARAAHGKVRHSVRWRTHRKRQWRQFAITNAKFPLGYCDWEYANVAELCERRQYSKRGWQRHERRMEDECGHYVIPGGDREFRISERYMRTSTSVKFTELGEIETDNWYELGNVAVSYIMDDDWSEFQGMGVYPRHDVAMYALGFNNRRALKAYFKILSTARLTLKILLARLIQAAYRAHVARRVRPVSKRARMPRPLYARPRPPSCPLAPPVTC